jgi:hypothetical protein
MGPLREETMPEKQQLLHRGLAIFILFVVFFGWVSPAQAVSQGPGLFFAEASGSLFLGPPSNGGNFVTGFNSGGLGHTSAQGSALSPGCPPFACAPASVDAIADLASQGLEIHIDIAPSSAVDNGDVKAGFEDTLRFANVQPGQTGTLTMSLTGGDALNSQGLSGDGSLSLVYVTDPSNIVGSQVPGSNRDGVTNSAGVVSFTFPLNSSDYLFFTAQLHAGIPEGFTGITTIRDPFMLSLPAGVTFTSASGVFSASPAAAPEPSPLLLLGSGGMIAALAGWRRVTRRSRVTSA